MIALDLDGTLLNSQSRVSAEDQRALEAAHARGIEIVPVTGRNYYSARPLLDGLRLDGTMISTNGAVVRSFAGQTHARYLLHAEAARAVLRAARDYRAYTVLMYDCRDRGQFRIERWPAARGSAPPEAAWQSKWAERNREFIEFVPDLESAVDSDPLEVSFRGPLRIMRELLRRLEECLPSASSGDGARAAHFRLFRTEYPQRDFAMVDAIHPACSKGRALEYWSRRRGVPREEVMAIGDNFNDVEMLRFAGLPVMMGNADEALRRLGWRQTRDCDSGGVAHAIAEFVL